MTYYVGVPTDARCFGRYTCTYGSTTIKNRLALERCRIFAHFFVIGRHCTRNIEIAHGVEICHLYPTPPHTRCYFHFLLGLAFITRQAQTPYSRFHNMRIVILLRLINTLLSKSKHVPNELIQEVEMAEID